MRIRPGQSKKFPDYKQRPSPPGYPRYSPNVTCQYAVEGMRPVTIIPREYDHSFYDDKPIDRTLDVYNDTLHRQQVTLKMRAVQGSM